MDLLEQALKASSDPVSLATCGMVLAFIFTLTVFIKLKRVK